ncbi:MAG: HAD-IIIA family hydrolase [Chloroflexi bacterium]|nr:HAD-IIIA family hydrolase [Chloroflexota bacterium]
MNVTGQIAIHQQGDLARARLVMLDRDGTLNVEKHYLSHPDQVELLPNAAAGLRRLAELGLKAVVATNQSAVARGYVDPPTLDLIHGRLQNLLAADGAALDAIYYCPHMPDLGCRCRKPGTELLDRACREFRVHAWESFVIGDQATDIEMGRRAGAITFLVKTGYGLKTLEEATTSPHYVVQDLVEAAEIIGGLLAPPPAVAGYMVRS